ncbi:hypothetical protein AGMMS49949_06820 [Alphaproteobacteria bacterium]|nr:hypothetical protein AGMMS49949_06820 [Alphaproteobacteria bacterium]GHS98579.1 hypothetical protein AGMMS50296_6330 [Alphaproteobacteria bacterium]
MTSADPPLGYEDLSVVCPHCLVPLRGDWAHLPPPQASSVPGGDKGWFFSCGRCNHRWWHSLKQITLLGERRKNIEKLQKIVEELSAPAEQKRRAFFFSRESKEVEAREYAEDFSEKTFFAPPFFKKGSGNVKKKPTEEKKVIEQRAASGGTSSEDIESLKAEIFLEVKKEIDAYAKLMAKEFKNVKFLDPRNQELLEGKRGRSFFPKRPKKKEALPSSEDVKGEAKKENKKSKAARREGERGETRPFSPQQTYSYRRVLPPEFFAPEAEPGKKNRAEDRVKDSAKGADTPKKATPSDSLSSCSPWTQAEPLPSFCEPIFAPSLKEKKKRFFFRLHPKGPEVFSHRPPAPLEALSLHQELFQEETSFFENFFKEGAELSFPQEPRSEKKMRNVRFLRPFLKKQKPTSRSSRASELPGSQGIVLLEPLTVKALKQEVLAEEIKIQQKKKGTPNLSHEKNAGSHSKKEQALAAKPSFEAKPSLKKKRRSFRNRFSGFFFRKSFLGGLFQKAEALHFFRCVPQSFSFPKKKDFSSALLPLPRLRMEPLPPLMPEFKTFDAFHPKKTKKTFVLSHPKFSQESALILPLALPKKEEEESLPALEKPRLRAHQRPFLNKASFLGSLCFFSLASVVGTLYFHEKALHLWRAAAWSAGKDAPLHLERVCYSLVPQESEAHKIIVAGEIVNDQDTTSSLCPLELRVFDAQEKSKLLDSWKYFPPHPKILPGEHLFFMSPHSFLGQTTAIFVEVSFAR